MTWHVVIGCTWPVCHVTRLSINKGVNVCKATSTQYAVHSIRGYYLGVCQSSAQTPRSGALDYWRKVLTLRADDSIDLILLAGSGAAEGWHVTKRAGRWEPESMALISGYRFLRSQYMIMLEGMPEAYRCWRRWTLCIFFQGQFVLGHLYLLFMC